MHAKLLPPLWNPIMLPGIRISHAPKTYKGLHNCLTLPSTSHSLVSDIFEITMPRPPPARTGIEQADHVEDHKELLQTVLNRSEYEFESAKAACKHIPFGKEPVSNNTSIAAAERERRRREAEASAAEGSTRTSRRKNTLHKGTYDE